MHTALHATFNNTNIISKDSLTMSVERKLRLTDQERQMYKSERLDNFRWISRIVASYSSVPLTDAEKVPDELCKQLSDVGK